MCQKCSAEVAHLKVTQKTSIKLSKEERDSLPGNSHNNKRIHELTEEEKEERRLYRRAYERLYRKKRNEKDSSLKNYQDAYHKAYQINHKTELRNYLTDYRKNKNPEWSQKAYRRRRARKLLVDTLPYTTQEILDTWGANCYLCDLPINLDAPRGPGAPGWEDGLHLDHVIPLSLGGSDTPDNVKPTHGRCNLRKHVTIVQEPGDTEEAVKVLFNERYGQVKPGRPVRPD